METNEIIEGNKLIAEFLGYEIRNGVVYEYIDSDKEPKIYWPNKPHTFQYQIWGDQQKCLVERLQYHSSWDWLIPAILATGPEVGRTVDVSIGDITGTWMRLVESIKEYHIDKQ